MIDDATSLPPTGSESSGAAFHVTATIGVAQQSSPSPTGTVTYSFFVNGGCRGGARSTQIVTIGDGRVPSSSSTGALNAGAYSFNAAYGGDGSHSASSSECEPFSVHRFAALTVAVQVMGGFPPQPVTGNEVVGATFFVTTTIVVTQTGNPVPSGTVTYTYFTNGACDGTAAWTKTVTITGGVVPSSAPVSPLAAGTGGFIAAYSGDANYPASASDCAGFLVNG